MSINLAWFGNLLWKMHPCEGQLGRARVERAAAKHSKRGPPPAQAFLQKSYGNEDLVLLTQSLASVLATISVSSFYHFAFLSTSAFPHPLQTSRCRSSTIGKPGASYFRERWMLCQAEGQAEVFSSPALPAVELHCKTAILCLLWEKLRRFRVVHSFC